MKNFKSTSNIVLHEWYLTLSNKPSTIDRFSYSELDEVYSYIENIRSGLYKTIIDFLNANPSDTFENRSYNTHTFNNSYIEFVQLLEFIKNRMTDLQGIQIFNKIIFNDLPSELFFKKVVDEWLSKTTNKKTAISYVFGAMWHNTNFDNKPENMIYGIVCSQSTFAKYWNKNFIEIYEFKDLKQPRLKQIGEITNNYYELSLSTFLNI